MFKLFFFIFILLPFIFCIEGHMIIFTLSNGKIIVVSKDSIHFFTSEIIEEKSKILKLDKKLSSKVIEEKIEITQFSQEDEEYIMILIMNKIYFFDRNGNKINYLYLSDELQKFNYSLIAYKKEYNYLLYIITSTSKNNKSFILNYYKYDINSPNSNHLISSKEVEINYKRKTYDLSKIKCIFIFSSNLNKNNLVCFFAVTYNEMIEIEARIFDQNSGLVEVNKFSKILEKTDKNLDFTNFISVETNKEKTKAFIYLVNGCPYIITFDLENSFSKFNKIIDVNYFQQSFSQHKLFYLKESNEFLIASLIKSNLCKIFIVYYNPNFEIKYQGVIDLIWKNVEPLHLKVSY